MEKREYCVGMDCLKIVSMLMIVCLHILGIGGVDSTSEGNSISYTVTWIMEIMCLCSVNCYGLVTGFLSYNTKPAKLKVRKLIYLWLEVFFYGILMTVISGLISDKISITYVEILEAALPICFSQYWYFTAYVGVYLLSPWLNKVLCQTEEKEDHILIGILFVLFSIYGTITTFWDKDIFFLKSGYSLIWLTILYLFGAYLKKYADNLKRIKKRYLVIGYVIVNMLTFIWKMMENISVVKKLGANMFLMYTSPLMLCSAICLVLLFYRINIDSEKIKKAIIWLASGSFAVYLIHVQPVFFKYVFMGSFSWIGEQKWIFIPCIVILFGICIYVAGVTFDKLRQWLLRIIRISY